MAAPTSVRVEAQSMTTTVLRWSYAGSSPMAIYRSTDGAAYSDIGSYVADGTEEYEDTDLDPGTKYWYKLSDDGGSTFSSVVSVYTHFCSDQNAGKAFMLPRFDEGQEDPAQKLNDLAERVENALGDLTMPESCVVCPDAGAVVIDCTDGCTSFFVVADEDINSFTINRCGDSDPRIDIYVPPSATRSICGFPPGYGFTGDECTEAPISGGTKGKTLSLGGGGAAGGGGGGGGRSSPGKPKTGGSKGGGSGGGRGGTACECVPGRNNELTLKCCTADCSMTCSSTKALVIKVCGGVGPYAFEHTGSVKFKAANGSTSDTATIDRKSTSNSVTVVPPANTGSAVAGDAYLMVWKYKCGNIGFCDECTLARVFSCADASTGVTSPSFTIACNNGNIADDESLECKTCHDAFNDCIGSGSECNSSQPAGYRCGNTETNWSGISGGTMCDKRTAGMITNGCTPCGLQSGSVITVTDAAGVSVSVTVKA
jgi:hypothetical protein